MKKWNLDGFGSRSRAPRMFQPAHGRGGTVFLRVLTGRPLMRVERQLKTPPRPSAACTGPTDVSPAGRFRVHDRVVPACGKRAR